MRIGLPADPEHLVRYLQALDRRGCKPATLARRIASLGTAHRLIGLGRWQRIADHAHGQCRAESGAAPERDDTATGCTSAVGTGLGPPCRQGLHPSGIARSMFRRSARAARCRAAVAGLRCGLAGERIGRRRGAAHRPSVGWHRDLVHPKIEDRSGAAGAWAWLSPDTMRWVGAWLEASGIREGPLFRRVGVDRRRARVEVAPIVYEAIPGNTRHWREKMEVRPAEAARTTYSIGKEQLTRQGVKAIYRRIAITAFDQGHVTIVGRQGGQRRPGAFPAFVARRPDPGSLRRR